MEQLNKEKLKELLEENVLSISFKKKDGSERQMICTLKKGVAGVYERKTDKELPKRAESNRVAVWDLEHKSFRSVDADTVLEWAVVA